MIESQLSVSQTEFLIFFNVPVNLSSGVLSAVSKVLGLHNLGSYHHAQLHGTQTKLSRLYLSIYLLYLNEGRLQKVF